MIIGGLLAPYAVLAESRDRAVDQPRINLQQRLVTEPQRLERARPIVLDQDIGAGDQLLEDLAAGFLLQIQGDRPLVRPLGQEGGAHVATVERPVGAPLTALVGLVRMLDLDDIGAEHRQLVGGKRPRQHMGDIDDANALEGSGHDWAPSRFGDRVLGWLCYGRGAPSPSIRPIEIYGIGWISAGLAVAAPHSAPYIPRVSIVAGERSKNGTGYGRRLRRQGPQ